MPERFRLVARDPVPVIRQGVEEQNFSVTLIPPPVPLGCKVESVSVDGVTVKNEGQKIGDVTVFNFNKNQDTFSFRTPRNAPPPKIEVTVVCPDNTRTVLRNDGISTSNPAEDTTDFIDLITGFFKKLADAAGDLTDFPGDLLDELKRLKALVGKGLDIVSNLLPGLKLFPNPASALLLLFPDNLEHLKRKIGEHLKDLDPLDDSREAVLADAAALRLLILEDIIPYIQQVGAVVTNDLQQYTQRLSVMRKMTARLGDQLDLMSVPTRRKRKARKK